jgi:hypothetical protein
MALILNLHLSFLLVEEKALLKDRLVVTEVLVVVGLEDILVLPLLWGLVILLTEARAKEIMQA